MIKIENGSLFDNLTENSVILHSCNAKGWFGTGISREIMTKYPIVFNEYYSYCTYFRDGHEDEILGTWHRSWVNPHLIICNAIAQITVGKAKQQTSYDAWHQICEKLEQQTVRVNKQTGKNWTIHAPYKLGSTANGNWEAIYDIFKQYFEDSDATIIFHKY